MPKRIKWPRTWDPDKGWLNSQSDHLLVTEPRTTTHWYKCLRDQGISLAERVHLLGGPEVPAPRTMEDCKREVRTYFKANGARPSHKTSAGWTNTNNWLRRQGSTLRQLCDDMELPPLYNWERTMEDCKREVRTYFKANGVRPSQTRALRALTALSKKWRNIDVWLLGQGSSLRQLCDDLGLPALLNLKRTKADCVQEVQAYFKANKKRPTKSLGKEWGNWDHWLRNRNTSLSKLCDEMGLPKSK